ncbi:AEC family transporter [Jiella sonneratiae]|uniref:AEC family transporter n=1 Tax=Jiella sonneratiae TaxID=2816856 RepID=A0ABS3J8N8_9HYPH|nr:AEC family transporter [Jiella sonneratiae]MBO0906029.1 AEC family transporter [Jiella sonneratiae]
MQTVLAIIVPIFSLIALGYAAARVGLLSETVGDGLAHFVFVVAVPVLLFRTLATMSFGDASPALLWLCYFAAVAVTWPIGTFLVRRFAAADHRTGVIAGISSSFANTVFVAIPTLQRAYGDPGLEPLLIIVSIHLPVMMIVSTLLIERAAGLDAAGEGDLAREAVPLSRMMKRMLFNLATNPIVVGIVVGLAWRALALPLEGVIDEVTKLLGGTAGGLALFSLGMSLTRYGLRGDLVASSLITVLSLVVMPAVVWLFAREIGLPPLWVKGAVLTAAAPAGINAYLFATYFKAGEKLAATTILVSTVASVVTLSAWLKILGV